MNIKPNLFKFLFILAILFTIINAQSEEEIKISSYAIEPFCNDFWTYGWDSNYILSQNDFFVLFSATVANLLGEKNIYKGKIYSPYLRYTLDSLGLDSWNIESPYSIEQNQVFSNYQKEKNKILKAISSAQEARNYLNLLNQDDPFFGKDLGSPSELYLLVISKDYLVIKTDMRNPSAALQITPEFIISFYFYKPKTAEWSKRWDKVMTHSTTALARCASGLNSLFLEAEKKALNLYEEGIEQENYISASKEAYIEWKNFVKNIRTYIKNKKKDSTIYSKYATAYFWSDNIKQLCNDPSPLPTFSPYGSVSFIFNQSCSLDDSLLSYALSMNQKLDKSKEILQKDLESSYSKAANTRKVFLDLKKALVSDEPLLFADDDFFVSKTYSLKAVNVSGTIPELYNQVFINSNLADQNMNLAQSKIPKVTKIFLYQNATSQYLKAIEIINQLNSTMSQKTNFACEQAQKEITRLQKSINSQKTSSNTNYSKLAIMMESHNRALSYLRDSEKELKLGKKFSLCQKAYLAAISSDKAVINVIISDLLNKFKEYVLTGEKLGADVSEYKKTYELFSSLYKSNYELDPEDIQSNIFSIKAYLNSFLEQENTLYEKLVGLLDQTKSIDSASYYEFLSEISKYRDKDGWSLYAFKNRDKLNSFLKSFDKKLAKQLNSYLSNMICNNAKFYATSPAPAYVGSVLDLGGIWESSNPLSIGVSDLNISCNLDYPFSYVSIKSKSENIQKLALNSKQLILYFTYLGPAEKIFVNFSEPASLVNVADSSCSLFIQSNNLIVLDANYTLNSLSKTSTILNLSWDTVSDFITANAQDSNLIMYPGNLKLNKNTQKPQVEFLVPTEKGKNSYKVKVSSNIKRNFDIKEQSISSPKPGVYSYSYNLVLKALPYCQNIYLERKENLVNLSNLKVEPLTSGYQLKNTKYSSAGGFWSTEIKRSPNSGESLILKVYFELSDPAGWFNSNYYVLLNKASKLNDSYSLNLLEKAQAYASNNDFTNAIKKIQEAKKYLLELEIDRDKHNVLSSKVQELTSYLNSLENFSTNNLTLNNKISKLKVNINSSIKNALSKSKTDVDGAILYLEKSIASLNLDIDKEVNSLLPKLEKNLDNLFMYALKNNLDIELLTNATNEIKSAKKYSNENKPLDALLALYSASINLESSSKELTNISSALLQDLVSKKLNLEHKFSLLSERLTKYSEEAKLLESRKTIFKPKLSSKDSQSLIKAITLAFKGWQEPLNVSFDKLAPKLEQNQKVLESADNLYNSSSTKYLEAKDFLAQKAKSLLDKAKIKTSAVSQEDKKSELLAKISNAENLINQEKYANAILELSDIVSQTQQPQPSSENSFPIFEVFISIVFIVAIIYVIFKSRSSSSQSQTNLKSQTKTLKKGQTN